MSPAIPEDLPEDVIRFIADYLDSVPQIEALMLLGDDPARAWTASELAARIYVSTPLAHEILAHLERRKLVVAAGSDRFRFNFDGPDATLFPKVAATYRRHLARVAGMIHSKASLGVLEFARAFRIKKEP